MLTQDDLRAIGKIIENKLGLTEIKLTNKVDSLETKLTDRIDLFETKIFKKVDSLDKKTNRSFKSVDRKLNVIINYFDHQDIDIRKKLNRIELHLGIAPLNS